MMNYIKRAKKKTKIIVLLATLAALVGVGFTYSAYSGSAASEPTVETSKKQYKTTYATKVKDEKKILIGKVLSHESASIFPRRSGIVEDILVDIGDSVRKGQVIAYLLPEGVENESGLEIRVQRDMMQRSLDDYNNTILVSAEEIENMEKKLDEEEIALERLKADHYEDGVGEMDDTLRLLSTELEEKIQLQEVRLRDAENRINQARDNLYTALEHVHLVALQVMGGGDSYNSSGLEGDLRMNKVSDSLGANDWNALNQAVISINQYRNELNGFADYQSLDSAEYFNLTSIADALLLDLQRVLNSSGTADPSVLDQLSNAVHNSQTQLLSAREKLENAMESYEITLVTEREGINLLQEEILKQGTEVESKILLMEASIEQYRQEIEYAKARVNKNIDSSENNYLVANSNYQKTAVQKGHTEIRAPFSGVISKRNINVGELAMSSQPIFDLIEVKTTLSKKAKNEIQFGLPEDLQSILEVGQNVEFYLPDAELTTYEAEITRMSPQVDEDLHTITVQAKIPDDLRLAHHTSVQVRIITGEKDTYQIDSSAIKRDGELNYLWIQNDEDISQLYIEVINEDGEFAEITGDISEDLTIVLNYYGSK